MPSPVSFKDYTLLVVDDEPILRDMIAADFKRKGFNVLTASNGSEAFRIVKSTPVHLVISDMRMPGGDGMSLLEQIRAYNPDIPTVIFVTGFAEVTEEECLAKGARKVLPKPFDRKVLWNCVLEALGVAPLAA